MDGLYISKDEYGISQSTPSREDRDVKNRPAYVPSGQTEILPTFSNYQQSGDIRGGTYKSYPCHESSNSEPLPQDKDEVVGLYTNSLPENYQRFVQLDIFKNNEIPKIDDRYVGRYAPQDENFEKKTRAALEAGKIDPRKHVVVVNSGGPHSIAAARALAEKGYLIIPHFAHQNDEAFKESTAALFYFAKEIAQLNQKTQNTYPAPPWALIIDAHENDRKGRAILSESDVPPISESYGVIEITEGHHDIRAQEVTEKDSGVWEGLWIASKRGVKELYILGLDPYKSKLPFSTDK